LQKKDSVEKHFSDKENLLVNTLDYSLYGIDHELFYFKNSDHTEISEAKDPTTYTAFLTAIDNKLKSL
jgi:hypothetical protein